MKTLIRHHQKVIAAIQDELGKDGARRSLPRIRMRTI